MLPQRAQTPRKGPDGTTSTLVECLRTILKHKKMEVQSSVVDKFAWIKYFLKEVIPIFFFTVLILMKYYFSLFVLSSKLTFPCPQKRNDRHPYTLHNIPHIKIMNMAYHHHVHEMPLALVKNKAKEQARMKRIESILARCAPRLIHVFVHVIHVSIFKHHESNLNANDRH